MSQGISGMSVAGVDGCAIARVKKEHFDEFAEELGRYYKDRIGYDCEVFSSSVGEGVSRV